MSSILNIDKIFKSHRIISYAHMFLSISDWNYDGRLFRCMSKFVCIYSWLNWEGADFFCSRIPCESYFVQQTMTWFLHNVMNRRTSNEYKKVFILLLSLNYNGMQYAQKEERISDDRMTSLHVFRSKFFKHYHTFFSFLLFEERRITASCVNCRRIL